jgi:hypothetical protein
LQVDLVYSCVSLKVFLQMCWLMLFVGKTLLAPLVVCIVGLGMIELMGRLGEGGGAATQV